MPRVHRGRPLPNNPVPIADHFNSHRWSLITAAAILLHLLLALGIAHQDVGLHYDEAIHQHGAVHMLHWEGKPRFAHYDPGGWIEVDGRWWPVMIMPYVGAGRHYLLLPVFALWGTDPFISRVVAALLTAFGIWALALRIQDRRSKVVHQALVSGDSHEENRSADVRVRLSRRKLQHGNYARGSERHRQGREGRTEDTVEGSSRRTGGDVRHRGDSGLVFRGSHDSAYSRFVRLRSDRSTFRQRRDDSTARAKAGCRHHTAHASHGHSSFERFVQRRQEPAE